MTTPSTISEQVRGAIGLVRSYGALAVVGAGVSAGHFPMSAQLPALLWQAIDSDDEALQQLRARVGQTGGAKELLGSEPGDLGPGWGLVRESASVRSSFQEGFAALDGDREPAKAHFELARLINSRHVEMVVSYNWDTCLERAYERLYGVSLPAGILHKPHGDAANPRQVWILPDEDGVVTDEVRRGVAALAERPRTLLVVGYSGSDRAVVESLLDPLTQRWPVVRVSPTATGEGAIRATADAALNAIAEALVTAAEMREWKYVTFHRSRSFLAALRGERLRPTDVDACPELPVVPRIAQRLLDTSFATLSGGSGTGKSISAFHTARRLNRAGWRVVELTQAGVADSHAVDEFARMTGPVLALVDDAQAIGREVLSAFESVADDTHAVLLVSTERLEARGGESILSSEAVVVLDEYCRRHLDTVGPMLMRLDDRVRWSIAFEQPPQRLDLARRTSSEPWLYMFVASGGERRIRTALNGLLEDEASTLAFAIVCAAQMISRDAGATREDLQRLLTEYVPDGTSARGALITAGLDGALLTLAELRLARETDSRIRAPHIRIAERALQELGEMEASGIGATIRKVVRAVLLDDSVPVLGKFWLFRVFDRRDAFRYRWAAELVDAEVSSSLVRQCLGAAPGRDRGVALNLVWASDWLYRLDGDSADQLSTAIIRWMPSIQAEELNGLHWMLSGLRSWHLDSYQEIPTTVPARTVGERLSTVGTRASAMDWAHVLRELFYGDGLQRRPEWVSEFEAGIDPQALRGWLQQSDEYTHPLEIWDLVDVLADVSPAVARIALEACAQGIREALENDLVDACGNFDWAFGSMWLIAYIADASGAPLFDRDSDGEDDEETNDDWSPTPGQEALAGAVLAVMAMVDWEVAARSVVSKQLWELSNLDSFLWWLSFLSVELTDRIAEAIPSSWWLGLMDQARDDRAGPPIDAIARLLSTLSHGERGNAVVRSFLVENAQVVSPFPHPLIETFPELAAEAILDGRSAQVSPPHQRGWRELKRDVAAVTEVSEEAAQAWVPSMVEALTKALEAPRSNGIEGAAECIERLESLHEAAVAEALAQIDVETARNTWNQCLADAPEPTRAVLRRIAPRESPAGTLARELLA